MVRGGRSNRSRPIKVAQNGVALPEGFRMGVDR